MKDLIAKVESILDKSYKEVIEASNGRNGKKSFDIFERSAKLLLDAKRHQKDFASIDFCLAFLGQINVRLLRSELWQLYISFCNHHNVIPCGKGFLFSQLELNNFLVRKINGDFVVSPPGKLPAKLREHTAKLIEHEQYEQNQEASQ